MKTTAFTPVLLVLVMLAVASPFRAAEAAWTDPPGDVPLPNADILSGSATVAGGMVDLRVQFAAPPFPTTATHHISWCFDTDQDPSTGVACGAGGALMGADKGFTLFGRPGALSNCEFSFSQGMPGLDAASQLWFDPATNTLRMLIPLSLLSDDGSFHYAVESAFGGSGGANERAPGAVGFGTPDGFFTGEAGESPAFHGSLWCANQPPAPTTGPAVSIRSDGLSLEGRATFEFSLREEAEVELAVHDMLGRRVATLERSHRRAGVHQVDWSTSELPAGTYFYRLRAGGAQLSKPVVILH